MNIIKSGSGRYNISTIQDHRENGKTGIRGYNKFIGWVLKRFEIAMDIKDETGKSFYFNRKSAIHWIERQNGLVSPNARRKEVIQSIKKLLDKLAYRPAILEQHEFGHTRFQPRSSTRSEKKVYSQPQPANVIQNLLEADKPRGKKQMQPNVTSPKERSLALSEEEKSAINDKRLKLQEQVRDAEQQFAEKYADQPSILEIATPLFKGLDLHLELSTLPVNKSAERAYAEMNSDIVHTLGVIGELQSTIYSEEEVKAIIKTLYALTAFHPKAIDLQDALKQKELTKNVRQVLVGHLEEKLLAVMTKHKAVVGEKEVEQYNVYVQEFCRSLLESYNLPVSDQKGTIEQCSKKTYRTVQFIKQGDTPLVKHTQKSVNDVIAYVVDQKLGGHFVPLSATMHLFNEGLGFAFTKELTSNLTDLPYALKTDLNAVFKDVMFSELATLQEFISGAPTVNSHLEKEKTSEQFMAIPDSYLHLYLVQAMVLGQGDGNYNNTFVLEKEKGLELCDFDNDDILPMQNYMMNDYNEGKSSVRIALLGLPQAETPIKPALLRLFSAPFFKRKVMETIHQMNQRSIRAKVNEIRLKALEERLSHLGRVSQLALDHPQLGVSCRKLFFELFTHEDFFLRERENGIPTLHTFSEMTALYSDQFKSLEAVKNAHKNGRGDKFPFFWKNVENLSSPFQGPQMPVFRQEQYGGEKGILTVRKVMNTFPAEGENVVIMQIQPNELESAALEGKDLANLPYLPLFLKGNAGIAARRIMREFPTARLKIEESNGLYQLSMVPSDVVVSYKPLVQEIMAWYANASNSTLEKKLSIGNETYNQLYLVLSNLKNSGAMNSSRSWYGIPKNTFSTVADKELVLLLSWCINKEKKFCFDVQEVGDQYELIITLQKK